MSIFYKSEVFDLTTTNLTTVLTISVSAVAVVKTVQAVHDTASAVDTDLFLLYYPFSFSLFISA